MDFHEDDKVGSETDSVEWDFSKNLLPSVYDVKFAPNFGRSFTVLATCDSNLKISFWKLNMENYKENEENSKNYKL